MEASWDKIIFQKQREKEYTYPMYTKWYDNKSIDAFYIAKWRSYTPFYKLFLQTKGSFMKRLRSSMNTIQQKKEKAWIEESRFSIKSHHSIIHLYVYRPWKEEKYLPCILYLHGGAYVGGGIAMSENVCRAISKQTHAVVCYVEYRLAPQAKFPLALEDSYAAIDWILQKAKQLKIRKDAFYVCGESAGGNLALGCCIKDIEKKQKRIKGCILFYPHLDMKEKIQDIYQISLPKNKIIKKWLRKDMLTLYGSLQVAKKLYLRHHEDLENPLISPYYYQNLAKLPPTLMIQAQYDALQKQGERFTQKVYEAGGDIRRIQYRGVLHAFLDHIGYLPQVYDAIEEIAFFIQSRKGDEENE